MLASALLAFPSASEAGAVKCLGKRATIIGTDRSETIRGTARADVIASLGGNDKILGKSGNDRVCGGNGNDTLSGGTGSDQLDGGSGADSVNGDDGIDQLRGGTGNDRLEDTSVGADTLTGGGDVDICSISIDDVITECEFDPTDKVFFVPYNKATVPTTVEIGSSSQMGAVDVYAIVDRSGSMASEITAIKNNLTTVVDGLQCDPMGTGTPPDCLDDLWAGAGTLGYQGSGAAAFTNYADIQPNPSFTSLPTTEPSSTNSQEASTFAVWSAITGNGGSSYSMASVPARASCSGSPADSGGYSTFGYPCFRVGATPVVVLATDEAPLTGADTYHFPDWNTIVRPAMLSRQARLVGLLGDGSPAGVQTDLATMATDTGAVDHANGDAALVFDGGGANAATGFQNAILTLIEGIPLNVSAAAVDDGSDAVDAAAAFVARVEVLELGTGACPDDLSTTDGDLDGHPDTYVGAMPGKPVCWSLVAKMNQTVPATSSTQVYRATVEVTVDGVSIVDQQEIWFVVPAA